MCLPLFILLYLGISWDMKLHTTMIWMSIARSLCKTVCWCVVLGHYYSLWGWLTLYKMVKVFPICVGSHVSCRIKICLCTWVCLFVSLMHMKYLSISMRKLKRRMPQKSFSQHWIHVCWSLYAYDVENMWCYSHLVFCGWDSWLYPIICIHKEIYWRPE